MDDYVRRQDVIDVYCEYECGKGFNRDTCGAECGTLFNKIPSANVRRNVVAHFVHKEGVIWGCSNCGAGIRIMKKYYIPNFCPACGARMEDNNGD